MRLALSTLLVLSTSTLAWADSYVVIVAGLGGEESYRERFHEWSMSMRAAALDRYGVAPSRVYYLGEKPEMAPDVMHAKSTKDNVIAVFDEIRSQVKPGDQLYVLLIGHGSFRSEQSRFNLPGPDITATDFEVILKPFAEQRVVFVNTASASGSFLPLLSAPNRIVVTATKSGMERNETQFGKYFVEAYSGDGADTDKNERVSVLEAFEFARTRVEQYYAEENLLKTEHAVLDDDGDGVGVGTPGEEEGEMAGSTYLVDSRTLAAGMSDEDLATTPELVRLVDKKRELEGRVESLRLQKETMPEDLYLEELERLLLELAKISREIDEKTSR